MNLNQLLLSVQLVLEEFPKEIETIKTFHMEPTYTPVNALKTNTPSHFSFNFQQPEDGFITFTVIKLKITLTSDKLKGSTSINMFKVPVSSRD